MNNIFSTFYDKFKRIKMVIMAALSAICIFIYAPLADENKPLDDTDKKAVRKKAQIIAILEFLVGLLLTIVNEKLAYAILSSVILCSITYVAWFVKKKRNVTNCLCIRYICITYI